MVSPGAQGGRDQQHWGLLGSSGVLSALGSRLLCRGVTPAPTPTRLVPDSVEGWSCQLMAVPPLWYPIPRHPHKALDSEATVCGNQNREESQAEVGDKTGEMTNYPSQHFKLGGGAMAWGGCPQLPQFGSS